MVFRQTCANTSRLIQNGDMKRDEALKLCMKYDGEFPARNLDQILEYLDISETEFTEIINKHRNKKFGKKNVSNEYF